MVILGTQFYVTEGLRQRNKLVFYRPREFQAISDKTLLHMVKSRKLEVVSNEKVAELTAEESSPGASALRFIPKTNGVRPVVMTR